MKEIFLLSFDLVQSIISSYKNIFFSSYHFDKTKIKRFGGREVVTPWHFTNEKKTIFMAANLLFCSLLKT